MAHVASVVFHGGAEVPALQAMIAPCGACVCGLVYQDSGAGRCQRGSVKIKLPKRLCMRRQVGVGPRVAQQVQCYVALWDELAPQVEWEAFITRAEASQEMILVGADGALGGVASVISSGCQLVFDTQVCDVFLTALLASLSMR